jgi:hypothetical protein
VGYPVLRGVEWIAGYLSCGIGAIFVNETAFIIKGGGVKFKFDGLIIHNRKKLQYFSIADRFL